MNRKLSIRVVQNFRINKAILPFLIFIFWGCVIPCVAAEENQSSSHLPIEIVKKNIQPLEFDHQNKFSISETTYFQYYGLNFPQIRHLFGSFISGNNKLAAHIFIPNEPIGTVVLLHGYFDHTGTLKNLIQFCLNQSLAVALYDLPGHGLSSGKRLFIDHFSEYATIFNDFINLIQSQMPEPFYLIGHSTGCSIFYEYLYHQSGKKQFFDKIVFLAPLVRHPYWFLSTMNYRLAKPFTNSFPRKFRENSSDPVYLFKTKKDPLQEKRFPIGWLEALYSWNEKIQYYDRLPMKILVIQGKDDAVVDWKYNIPFLKNKFDTVIVKWIPKARHQLINEEITLRRQVLETIRAHIK